MEIRYTSIPTCAFARLVNLRDMVSKNSWINVEHIDRQSTQNSSTTIE